MKRISLRLLLTAASLALSCGASAATYPDQPIRLTVGFPAGTGPDVVARTVGDQLATELGQSVVVENKAGAGGQIAANSVAQSKPDGYTLLLGEVGSMSITPETTSKLSYAPLKDFDPITEAVRVNFVLVTPPDSPYKTLKEFIDAARTSKESFNIATFGAGTPGHFGAEMLADAAGFKIVPIHYRSTGDAVSAIIGGQVQGAFITTAMAASQVGGGKMGALAITGKERSKTLPSLPTFKESGLSEVNFGAWFAFFAPDGTPDAVLNTLNSAVVKSLQAPNVRKVLEEAGFVIIGSSRDDMKKLMIDEQKRWSAVVKKTGFRID
jgi:tripartite-type tricarboxylate transporter receptor subunit TctC